MTKCKICGITDMKTVDEIVDHINAQHLTVARDDTATRGNIDRLVREVAICWQQHNKRERHNNNNIVT